MSELTVAIRYARALYEEAERNGEVASVDADAVLLRESFATAPEFERLLRSPIISSEKKADILRELLEDRLQARTLRFIFLLVEKEREDLLPQIIDAYQTLRDEQQGIVEATASLALAPGEEERSQLQDAIETMTGKRVRLKVMRNPALIGGVVVRVGDTVYDGSVLNQLKSLRQQLRPGQLSVDGDGQLR